MAPTTYEEDTMGEETEYEVLRDHGTKPAGMTGPAYVKGDTRTMRPESAATLVAAGVLRRLGEAAADRVRAKMEEPPANKAEPPPQNKGSTLSSDIVKRGPGRPRTNPPAIDDDEDEA